MLADTRPKKAFFGFQHTPAKVRVGLGTFTKVLGPDGRQVLERFSVEKIVRRV